MEEYKELQRQKEEAEKTISSLKKARKKAKKELELIESQMNSHFVEEELIVKYATARIHTNHRGKDMLVIDFMTAEGSRKLYLGFPEHHDGSAVKRSFDLWRQLVKTAFPASAYEAKFLIDSYPELAPLPRKIITRTMSKTGFVNVTGFVF